MRLRGAQKGCQRGTNDRRLAGFGALLGSPRRKLKLSGSLCVTASWKISVRISAGSVRSGKIGAAIAILLYGRLIPLSAVA